MIVRNLETGHLEFVWAPGEFEASLERWKNKPETKAMFARFAAERKARIAKIMADIEKSRQK